MEKILEVYALILLTQHVTTSEYMGCYKDESERALSLVTRVTNMTIDFCIGYCTYRGKESTT